MTVIASRLYTGLLLLISLLIGLTLPAVTQAQTSQTPHDGLGMNLYYVTYAGDMLYFNELTRHGSHWLSSTDDSLSQMENGYPADLAPGQTVFMIVVEEMRGLPAGNYMLEWQGEGELNLRVNNEEWLFSSADDDSLQSLTITPDDITTIFLEITATDPADPLRDIRLWLPGTRNNDSIFYAPFIERLRPFSLLRFTDWGVTNVEVGTEDIARPATWENRPHESWYTWASLGADGFRGVPYDVMIELVNELDVDMWVNVPHRADDTYIQNLAQLLRDTLEPERRVYVEYTNEHWNWIFEQALYVNEQAERIRSDESHAEYYGSHYYGRRTGETLQIFERVFDSQHERVIGVLAGQAGWRAPLEVALEEVLREDTLSSVDVIAIAPYFGNGDSEQMHPVDAAILDALPDLDESELAQLFDLIEADVRALFDPSHEIGQEVLANKALADRHQLPIVTYEGGQHYTTWGLPEFGLDEATVEAVGEAYAAINRHPAMYDIYTLYLDLWRESYGGCTFTLFHLGGAWWWNTEFFGHLEYSTQPIDDAHKYRAVRDWQANHADSLCQE